MVLAAPSVHYSYAEYMDFEAQADTRHEYVSGLILAMAGGTLEHSALCSAVIAMLSAQLAGKRCRVFDSNARVRMPNEGNAYYPDASVVCGQLERDVRDRLAMTNPVVLVEVLSPSTQSFDRTDKLREYQTIPSLRHVVHVAHDSHRVDVCTRAQAGWSMVSFAKGDVAALGEIECVLEVDALYRDPLA